MESLYELPDGWEWKKLSDVTTELSSKEQALQCHNKPYLSLENIESYTGNIINYQTVKESNIIGTCSNFNLSSVIYSKLRPYLNKVATPNFDGVGTTELIVFLPEKNLDRYYLAHFLRSSSVVAKINASSYGSKMPRANSKFLRQLDFPLPPLPEQQRIVSKLDLLFEKIDKSIALHQKNMDEANAFMGSVLNDVFGELRENFQTKRLNEISNIISGYAFKSGDFSNSNEIRSIKITNVGVQNFVEEDENFLPKDFLQKLSKYTAKERDIIIALTRPYISNGLKVTFVPKTYDGAFVNQRVAAIQSKDKITTNNYIYHYLCTSDVLTNVMELSKTLNQPNLSIKDLSNFEIPLPPLHIQQKVVSYLDEMSQKIEKIKQLQKEKMDSLKALKASILDSAFRGEL